ncbi:MAG: hypothetical protein JWO89_2817 [Verrucomicrobiaceae bacterium]|nr:hypothetical protein [Verrucomicrobiaceae bacterium]
MRILTILALSSLLKVALGVEAPEGKDVLLVDDPKQPFLISHELQVNIFLGSGGEGIVRMDRTVPGIHGLINQAPLASWETDDQTVQRAVFDLIGIGASPAPRVYLVNTALFLDRPQPYQVAALSALPAGPRTTEQRKGGSVTFRTTDWFEDAAIKQLKAGHALVTYTEGHVIRAVGAIRASESCLRCHDQNKAGDLLGAFTYFAVSSPGNDKVKRDQLAKLLDQKAAPDEIVAALGYHPRERQRHADDNSQTPEMWTNMELARNGFVTQTLISAVQKQREDLEVLHGKYRIKMPTRDGMTRWRPGL